MGREKIVKRRYFIAFLITLSVFILGIFFGFIMDNIRVDFFSQLAQRQELDYRSLQLQYQLMDSELLGDQCQGLKQLFDNYIKELEYNREQLENYIENAEINKEEYLMLKRRYTLSQINFWYISELLKTSCPESSDYVTIIYLYGTDEDCPKCDELASYLGYFKKKLGTKLLVFAIDSNFKEEPIIDVLKNSFDVTELPGVIIDGKNYGFLDKEQLKQKICELLKYPDQTEICNN